MDIVVVDGCYSSDARGKKMDCGVQQSRCLSAERTECHRRCRVNDGDGAAWWVE